MADKIKSPIKKGVAKVPVVMQLEALECGAASLCMILAYYSKWIPLEQVREDCGVSRDGSNARNIMKAARFYGLQARGFRYEPETLRENGSFPCIIHWNFNHFVVLDGAVDYPMFKLEGGASLRSASLVAPIFYAFAVSFPPAFSRMIMKITPRTMRAI